MLWHDPHACRLCVGDRMVTGKGGCGVSSHGPLHRLAMRCSVGDSPAATPQVGLERELRGHGAGW